MDTQILKELLEITKKLMESGSPFEIDVKAGEDTFKISNKESKDHWRKKPSQKKRDDSRRDAFFTSKYHNQNLKAPTVDDKKVGKKPNKKVDKKPETSTYLKCDQCDSTFLTDNGLKVHIEMMHQKAKPVEVIKCKYCIFRGPASEVDNHIKRVHMFDCVACPYAVETEDRLVNHMMLAHGYLV
jgi:hypothetical protein